MDLLMNNLGKDLVSTLETLRHIFYCSQVRSLELATLLQMNKLGDHM